MFTDEIESEGGGLDLVKNNYSVARVNHDFAKSRSSLGGIFVNRNGIGLTDDYNRVFALDGRLGLAEKSPSNGLSLKKVVPPGIESKDHAFNILAVYNWNGWKT